jgi:hypothetical protein
VLRFEVSRSVVTVQREFRARFYKNTLLLRGASHHFAVLDAVMGRVMRNRK